VIVAVVDYRAGNLASVVKALAAAGATPRVVTRTAGLTGADAIVVPGVGHFDAARVLDEGDRRVIAAHVQAGVPLLGICLGMQWLFEGSDESPGAPGLGVFAGRSARMERGVGALENQRALRTDRGALENQRALRTDSYVARHVARPGSQGRDDARDDDGIKIPHVGWNTLEPTGRPSRILEGLPAGVTAYFTHSYAAPVGEDTVARTTHGATFASVVERGRVFGTQFHPEKSGAAGVHMLRRFVDIAREAGVQC
jgi:glutamine amidotransferase